MEITITITKEQAEMIWFALSDNATALTLDANKTNNPELALAYREKSSQYNNLSQRFRSFAS